MVPEIVDPPYPPSPDEAWKVLTLVNEWIKHAEVKLGATLASSGASGAILFNLIDFSENVTIFSILASTVCGATVALSGLFAMIGLYPVIRVRHGGDRCVNPIFFQDIAASFEGNPGVYLDRLTEITGSPEDLVRHIGQQIYANSMVARRKYRWANRAVRTFLLSITALGLFSVVLALS